MFFKIDALKNFSIFTGKDLVNTWKTRESRAFASNFEYAFSYSIVKISATIKINKKINNVK